MPRGVFPTFNRAAAHGQSPAWLGVLRLGLEKPSSMGPRMMKRSMLINYWTDGIQRSDIGPEDTGHRVSGIDLRVSPALVGV